MLHVDMLSYPLFQSATVSLSLPRFHAIKRSSCLQSLYHHSVFLERISPSTYLSCFHVLKNMKHVLPYKVVHLYTHKKTRNIVFLASVTHTFLESSYNICAIWHELDICHSTDVCNKDNFRNIYVLKCSSVHDGCDKIFNLMRML